MSNFKKPGGSQGLSREERQDLEDQREARKFPRLAKWFLTFCFAWTTFWAILIAKGWWASKTYGCTVEITFWDAFIGDSVVILGVLGLIILIIQFHIYYVICPAWDVGNIISICYPVPIRIVRPGIQPPLVLFSIIQAIRSTAPIMR